MNRTASFTMCFACRTSGRPAEGPLDGRAAALVRRHVFEGKLSAKYPEIASVVRVYLQARPELMAFIHDPFKPGYQGRFLGSILNEANLRRVLAIMLDEKEF